MSKDEAFKYLSDNGFKPFYENSLISVRVDNEKAMKVVLNALREVDYHSTIRVIIGKEDSN